MFRAHVLIVMRAKIVLYSLWYHHTETSEWSKITKINKIIKIQFYKYEHMVKVKQFRYRPGVAQRVPGS